MAEGEAVGKHVVRALAWLFFKSKRLSSRVGHAPRALRWLLMPPLRWLSGGPRGQPIRRLPMPDAPAAAAQLKRSLRLAPPGLIGGLLSGAMLVACEVAVEYWMGLTWSPQAQWLRESQQAGPLQVRAGATLRFHWPR